MVTPNGLINFKLRSSNGLIGDCAVQSPQIVLYHHIWIIISYDSIIMQKLGGVKCENDLQYN